jgi:hypothetical protein
MKKNIFILHLLMISTCLSAQNYNSSIGIKYNPGIATLYNPFIKGMSYYRFSQSGGIELSRLISDKFYLETGLFLYDRGYKVDQHYTDNNGNYIGINTSIETQYYLTLPFNLKYKQNGFYFGAGPNINYYLARRFYYNGDLISKQKVPQSDNIIFGAQAFLGYEMKLSARYLLTVDAFINPTLEPRFMNYGLGVGVRYILEQANE